MTKIIVSILTVLTLLSVTAVADTPLFAPKVGDLAVYDIQVSDLNLKGQRMVRLEHIDHRQAGVTIYMAGFYTIKSDGSLRPLGRDSIFQLEKLYFTELASACAEMNGAIENVTVPAGIFAACKVSKPVPPTYVVTQFYAANIPFGLVKEIVTKTSDASYSSTQELNRFEVGK
ncbi:MAG: hypothetical protein H7222_06205 [Methylotenera sp.]|nr:hypothetical protein [Oligoflexia bacterium]